MNAIFIALPIPKNIKSQLERLCFGLPHVNWTEHSYFHLTLHYIGPVDDLTRLDIQEALNKIRFAPFNLSLQGIGYFNDKSKGTVWAGVAPSQELEELKKTITNQLKPLIQLPLINKMDKKPFVPHITLGRFKTIDKRRLYDYLDAHSSFFTIPFSNEAFLLMESQKTAEDSSHYLELARFRLIPPINKLRILND